MHISMTFFLKVRRCILNHERVERDSVDDEIP